MTLEKTNQLPELIAAQKRETCKNVAAISYLGSSSYLAFYRLLSC